MNSVVSIKGSNINIDSVNGVGNVCSDCNGGVFFFYGSKYLTIKNSTFD